MFLSRCARQKQPTAVGGHTLFDRSGSDRVRSGALGRAVSFWHNSGGRFRARRGWCPRLRARLSPSAAPLTHAVRGLNFSLDLADSAFWATEGPYETEAHSSYAEKTYLGSITSQSRPGPLRLSPQVKTRRVSADITLSLRSRRNCEPTHAKIVASITCLPFMCKRMADRRAFARNRLAQNTAIPCSDSSRGRQRYRPIPAPRAPTETLSSPPISN